MSVHEKIRFLRKEKGLTQEELAEKLDMSVNGYGDIERGHNDIKLSKLEKIAELLDVELKELFSVNEKNSFLSIEKGSQRIEIGKGKNYYNIINPQHLEFQCGLEKQKQVEIIDLEKKLEKQKMVNEKLVSEITLLREVIGLGEKGKS